MAPRVPVPIREIVYTLSPYNQEIVVKGMQKFPIKIAKYFQRNALGLAIFSTVLFAPVIYANSYKEDEKMSSRY